VNPLNIKVWPGHNLAGLKFYLFAGPGAEGAKGKLLGAHAVLNSVATVWAGLDKVALIAIGEGNAVIKVFSCCHLSVQTPI